MRRLLLLGTGGIAGQHIKSTSMCSLLKMRFRV